MQFPLRGAPDIGARAWAVLKHFEERPSHILIITGNEAEFSDWKNAFLSLKELLPELPGFSLCLWSGDAGSRARAMRDLFQPREKVFNIHIMLEELLSFPLPAARIYTALSVNLRQGSAYKRSALTDSFLKSGYERVQFVEERGEFAVRGSVIDVFAVDAENPVRLFFSENILESIREFDITTQHTGDFVNSIDIQPKNFPGAGATIADFIEKSWQVYSDYPTECDYSGDIKIFKYLLLPEEEQKLAEDFGAESNKKFNGDLKLLTEELRRLKRDRIETYLYCVNRTEQNMIAKALEENGAGGTISLKQGFIDEGFIHGPSKTAVITTSEIFNRKYRFDPSSIKPQGKHFKWTDLKAGDFVVHEDFGIGRYLGIKKIYYTKPDGEEIEDSDCLNIEYARGDRLYVPIQDFTLVQKYISSEGKTPRLSHMDTKTWREMKYRVKEEVQELAKDILKLEAERHAVKTVAMPNQGSIEDDFAETFPFEETQDQEKAIQEVMSDLSKDLPMNRLIAGDVGFGKTEIAMRAAMRVAANGFQTAVLAPTTILAEQHYRTFSKRFQDFPVRIKVLSRYVSKAQSRKIIKELAAGEIDIIIGTHRIIQKDIKFAKLGLMIVDEEHRFGVKDKDKIKTAARGVHCLMMSATPIPRTLYQSLSSLKSMSVIESAPVGRQSVATFVRPFSEKGTAEAVSYELSRGGQVYYVYNRVKTIETRRAFLHRLMPELRIAVIHGKQSAEESENTMRDFLNRKYDVLMATTIIESGIDIPDVNTLIVEDAHKLGLAQLYQLRGRIGRNKQKAYCYLYYPPWLKNIKNLKEKERNKYIKEEFGEEKKGEQLTEIASKRLSALEEFSELGSGLRLAMRDLEIRGAGELLGVRQHGFINSIGLEMYIKLLNGEIDRIKGRGPEEEITNTQLDLLLPAFIPESYIEDEMERLNFYKKILKAGQRELPRILSELEDLSGPAPEQVKNLLKIADLKIRLGKIGARKAIQNTDGSVEVYFSPFARITGGQIERWTENFGGRLSFLPSKEGDGIKVTGAPDPESTIKAITA